MRTFAQTQKPPQEAKAAGPTRPVQAFSGQARALHPILQLPRTVAAQPVRHSFQPHAQQPEAGSTLLAPTTPGHNFSTIPLRPAPSAGIQAKLAVGQPNDPYEREADRVADQVLRLPEPRLQRACACGGVCPKCQLEQPPRDNKLLQTKGLGSSDLALSAAPPIVTEVLQSPGQSLDPATRAFMEPRFGHDFSRVRVHAEPRAAAAARTVSSIAFTLGTDIVFGAGHYTPQTPAGRRLIAHELAHVIQQIGKRCLPMTLSSRQHSHPSIPFSPFSLHSEPSRTLRRVPLEGFGPAFELEQERLRQKDRLRYGKGEVGAGPEWEDLKQAGYSYLIDLARGARESYVKSLRERAMDLPAGLQPAALNFIDVIDLDLQAILSLLFFDLGLVVGFGEGIANTVVGAINIVIAIINVAFHLALAIIGAVQRTLADIGLSEQTGDDLLRPLGEDIDQGLLIWDNVISFDLLSFLEACWTKFSQAPAEHKALMAGELVGEIAAFVATWSASSARLGKFIPPAPAAAPQLIAEVAGGGAISLPMPATTEAAKLAELVRLGGPRVGGLAVTSSTYLMSASERVTRTRVDPSTVDKWYTGLRRDYPMGPPYSGITDVNKEIERLLSQVYDLDEQVRAAINSARYRHLYAPGYPVTPANSTISLAVGWRKRPQGWESRRVVNANSERVYRLLDAERSFLPKGFQLGDQSPEAFGYELQFDRWSDIPAFALEREPIHAELISVSELTREGYELGIVATSNLGCETCVAEMTESFGRFLHANPTQR